MAVVSEHLRRFVCNVPGFMHVRKRDLYRSPREACAVLWE